MFAWPLTARAQKLGGTARFGFLQTAPKIRLTDRAIRHFSTS